jgi:hypothetical protein
MDEELLKALKERIMREINMTPQSAPAINIYNSLPTSLQDVMTAGGSKNPANDVAIAKEAEKMGVSPEELEYMVNISRRDVEAVSGFDPESGEPIKKKVGWDKKVHRFTVPKGEAEDFMALWHDPESPTDMIQNEFAKGGESAEAGLGSLMAEPTGDFAATTEVQGKRKRKKKEASLFEQGDGYE